MEDRSPELADILRRWLDEYQERGGSFCQVHRRAVRAILACRTEALGGHRWACDACGAVCDRFNSCGDRHCPKCQYLAKQRWLESRTEELLPVGYFHLIFTVPPALNPIFLRAPKLAYSLLFRAAGESLLEVAADPRHLGAQVGAVAVLHTWGQRLQMHPHVHCIVPGGGLSLDGERWVPSAPDFLVPVKVLSKEFRKKLLGLIQRTCRRSETLLPDDLDPVEAPNCHRAWLDGLESTPWAVYSKPPFGGAEKGLEYLARYTHRVAISNERLLAIRDDRVVFRWKDYRDGGTQKVSSLAGVEFVRRFLQHVLPRGFQRIRYYGLLANRYRRESLERCRQLLGVGPSNELDETSEVSTPVDGSVEDPVKCPVCEVGRLILRAQIPATSSWGQSRAPPLSAARFH